MQRLILLLLAVIIVAAVMFIEWPQGLRSAYAVEEAVMQRAWSPGPMPSDSPDDPAGPYGPHRPYSSPRPESWPGGSQPSQYQSMQSRPEPSRASWSPRVTDDREPAGEVMISDETPPAVRPQPPERRTQPQPQPQRWTQPEQPPQADLPRTGYPRMEPRQAEPVLPETPRPRPPVASRPVETRQPERETPKADPQAKFEPIEGSRIVATVGKECILSSEVSIGLHRIRQAFKDQAPPDALEARIREEMRKQLDKRIEEKLLCQDAVRNVPGEGVPHMRDMMGKDYENKMIPELMKKFGAESRHDLNEKFLSEWGIPLETHKKQFIENGLAQVWLRQQVKADEEVGHDEMLEYYRDHVSEFELPARVKWEELVVRKRPDAQAAYVKICAMGNRVLDGTPLTEVAKADSQGPTAAMGGLRDWTSQGSLVSESLDRALFKSQLKPGELSAVFEDDQAYYVVRIVELQPPVRKPFLEAQDEIREGIRKKRALDAKAAYLAKLRRQTPVRNTLEEESQTAALPDFTSTKRQDF